MDTAKNMRSKNLSLLILPFHNKILPFHYNTKYFAKSVLKIEVSTFTDVFSIMENLPHHPSFLFFFILPKICENLLGLVQIWEEKDWQLLLIDLDFIHTKINDLSRLFSKMF